jgi:hypothetical protein
MNYTVIDLERMPPQVGIGNREFNPPDTREVK